MKMIPVITFNNIVLVLSVTFTVGLIAGGYVWDKIARPRKA
jgi:hypothetical protein